MRFHFLSLFAVSLTALAATHDYDLVVYGGTAGGVATAISGARHGLKTVLLEPRRHVGGMATGGLSRTDTGTREVIGGLALEFIIGSAMNTRSAGSKTRSHGSMNRRSANE